MTSTYPNPTRVNFRSDFDFELRMKLPRSSSLGTPIRGDRHDWEAVFTTVDTLSHPRPPREYKASRRDGQNTNCNIGDNGEIYIIMANHSLPPGRLWCNFSISIPDRRYPDGTRLMTTRFPVGIELTNGATDIPVNASVSVTMPIAYISAYELACEAGYEGTREEYIALLQSLPDIAARCVAMADCYSRSEIDAMLAETKEAAVAAAVEAAVEAVADRTNTLIWEVIDGEDNDNQLN